MSAPLETPSDAPHRSSTAPPRTNTETLVNSASLLYRPVSIVERLNWSDLFSEAQPVEVELGSGDGGFLVQYAAANRDRNFLGVERLLGRIRKIDRKGRRAGLSNLRATRLEASYVVQYLLPHGSIRAMHIYFPDPWPKRRHHKHRLITSRFAESVRAVLEPGGTIYLRTDDRHYFDQMLAVFGANPAFAAVDTPGSLSSVLTDFERGFNARGVPTLRAAYQRTAP